jgi:hypothetical protein
MARERKTVDVWEFWFNYGNGNGWECETVEYTLAAMRVNREAYIQAGCIPTIRKRRIAREKVDSYEPKWR